MLEVGWYYLRRGWPGLAAVCFVTFHCKLSAEREETLQ